MNNKKIKEFVLSYEDENGNNPITSVFNIMTFSKAIPFEIVKGIIVALSIYIIVNISFVSFDLNWYIIASSVIVGLIPTITLAIVASLSNISTLFIDTVNSILLGVLHPFNIIYDQYLKYNDDISKKDFLLSIIRDVIIPNVLKGIPSFFRSKINKNLYIYIDNFEDLSEENLKDDNIINKLMETIEESSKSMKRFFNYPYISFLKICTYSYFIIIILHLIFLYK